MQAAAGQAQGGAARKRQVLIVDDEPQVLVALEDVLGDDYDILTATSPLAALRLLEKEKDVAVLLSDQRMPGMNGDELLALSADLSDATRVMVTGFAELAAVIRAVNNGRIYAYVTKPWDGAELQMTVRKCVEHFELLRKLAYERQLLEDLMNNSPDAIYFKDRELRFQRVNQAFAARLALHDAGDAIGKRLSELALDSELATDSELDEAHVLGAGGSAANFIRSLNGREGRRFYSTTVAPIMTVSGDVQGLVGISRDVTEKEETERALRRLTHVRTMLGAVNAAILRVKERDALIQESCRIAVEDGGLLAAAIVLVEREGGLVKKVVSHGDEALAQAFVNAWMDADAQDGPWNQSTLIRALKPTVVNHVNGAAGGRWTVDIASRGGRSAAVFPLVSEDRLVGVLALSSAQPDFFDNEETRLLSELADNIAYALEHLDQRALLDFLAYYDELTNLPKRELLLDRLHQAVPGRAARGERLALVLVDLSRFRSVNETLGRVGGDELLVQVSRRLAATVAEGDTLARYDGNGFAFVLAAPGEEADLSAWLESNVFGALAAPLTVRGTELRVAVRVGVALTPEAGDAERLVRHAEAALANARATGERCRFYDPSMKPRAGEKLTLETRLRRAFDAHEFALHYQPKLDLKTGVIVGLEALLRWSDPERGLVPPAQFVPLLEETGLILDVGHWVLERAAAECDAWAAQGLDPPRVAVNVSALQLAQRTFARTVEDVLARYPAARHRLDLEITESVLMGDLTDNIDKLRALKAQDVRIAIDDFGTGYSSLSYLSRLPIDALKIDRSFVLRMSDDSQDMTIVTTIISLAHSLDLHVVAEGVETADQARLLRLVRCDQIQGYLVGKPVPAAEIATLFGSAPRSWALAAD